MCNKYIEFCMDRIVVVWFVNLNLLWRYSFVVMFYKKIIVVVYVLNVVIFFWFEKIIIDEIIEINFLFRLN